MTVAATGHRPPKLGGYGVEASRLLHALAYGWLKAETPFEVICGMAQGWDQAMAHAAIDLGIPVVAAVPFEGQERLWTPEARVRYHAILKRASRVVIISPAGNTPTAMQDRNEWMVDRADKMLALWDGTRKGGTWNCLRYAHGRRVPVENLWGTFQQLLKAP